MLRPTDKLLKEMSNDDLRAESEWHATRSQRLLEEVRRLRSSALESTAERSLEILCEATDVEAEAEAHRHQSLVLLMACQPSEGVTPIRKVTAGSNS
jgi:hypothetical protein